MRAGFPRRGRRLLPGILLAPRQALRAAAGTSFASRWTARAPRRRGVQAARRPQCRRTVRVRTSPTAWATSARRQRPRRPCCSRPPTSPTSPTPRPPGRRCHQRGDRREARPRRAASSGSPATPRHREPRCRSRAARPTRCSRSPGAASVGGGNVANLRAVEVAGVKAVVGDPHRDRRRGCGRRVRHPHRRDRPGRQRQSRRCHGCRVPARQRPPLGGAASGTANSDARRGKDHSAYANRVRPVRNATNGSPSARSICSSWRTARTARSQNLSMNQSDGRYVEASSTTRNGSVYVRVIDQLSSARPPAPRPWRSRAAASLVGLDDNDFIAASPPGGPSRAPDQVQELSLLLVGARRPPSTTRWCVTARSTATARSSPLDPPADQARRTSSPTSRRPPRSSISGSAPSTGPREGAQPGQACLARPSSSSSRPRASWPGVFTRTDSAQPGGV